MAVMKQQIEQRELDLQLHLKKYTTSSSSQYGDHDMINNGCQSNKNQPIPLSSAHSDQGIVESLQIPELKMSQSSVKQKCHYCNNDINKDKYNSSLGRNAIMRHTSSDSRHLSEQYSSRNKNLKHNVRSDSLSGSATARALDHDYLDSSQSANEFGETDSVMSHECNELVRIGSDYLHGYSHHENSPMPNERSKQHKRKLDLAYLYADPLMERNKDNKLIPINQPLDTDKELREIQKFIQSSKKAFVVRKEAVNFETLKRVLAKQPSIIHISCHGDYDEEQKQFYLAFEEKDTGILDKLTEDRFKKLLGEDAHHKVHLAFVSACHSEMIGKIFLRAKIPVVVAVNSHSLIADDVCQLFARHFYCSLLDGYSAQVAFYDAQRIVQSSNIEKYSCCCAHDHTPDCRWQKYALRYGYEKAHEIHTPNCKCTFEQNYHLSNCSYSQQFKNELDKIQVKQENYDYLLNMDIDDEDLPDINENYSKPEQVCCCYPDLPHDESIKFMLYGSEDAKNMVLFKNRVDGQMMLDADVNQHNKLPQVIDQQMLVGRNKELQQVVQFLFSDAPSKRLIHIYGNDGVGKSAIAKYSAKYTLDRRKFTDGVYYVEVQNRASGQGIVSKICQKLMLPNCTKEQLCEIIKSSHLLIILDNCKDIIEQSKSSLNKTLKEIIENTTFTKILVVSKEQDDIKDDVKFKVQFELNPLSKLNAAKLLLLAAGQSKHLKQHQNPRELSNHRIFNQISFKPSVILQMAPLLFEKSLDEIAKEQELQMQKDINNNLQPKQMMEFKEFSWIMSISYRDLQTKFNNELNLLYLLCQTPGGLTDTDIELICTEKPQLYGDYQKFINAIIQDDPGSQTISNGNNIKDTSKSSVKKPKDTYKSFRLVTSNYSEELAENHYIPQPIVSEYINTLVLNSTKKNASFQECFRYMSKLSRRLLRSIKVQKHREIDVYQVSAEIDLGIWSDSLTSVPISNEMLESQLVYNADLKFGYNESNFIAYLDQEILKEYFQKLDFKNVFTQYLDELCVNIPTILIMLGRSEEALALIEKCKTICNGYNLRYCKAKLLLMKVSLLLKMNIKTYEIHKLLEQAETIFLDLGFKEGYSEALFLKAVDLIQTINNTQQYQGAYKEQYSFQGIKANNHGLTTPHLLERSTSVEGLLDQSRFKPLINQSLTPTHRFGDHQGISKQTSTHFTQIENVLQYLSKARKFFKNNNQEFGIAKTNLIEAEFQIQNSIGIGMLLEYDPKKISNMLSESIVLFKKFRCESQAARCFQNLAELEYNLNDCFQAKNHIENAIQIIKRIQDKHQEAIYSKILNKILHKIRIQSHNVFIFIKAFPLVEIISNNNARVVGTFTRYPSNFRNKIHTELKRQKKIANVKFDNLTRDQLEYIKAHGCRVLHISSDVYNPDYLCIEGKHGEIQYLTKDDIKNILKPENGRLNVDVVVVAIPESGKIAQAFVDLGVPHVVGFDFKSTLTSTFMDNIYALPKRYDYIYDFCCEFYKNILLEKTVYQAWKLAKPSLNDGIRKINDSLGTGSQLTKEDVGLGPLLLPANGRHKVKLFDSNSDDEKMQLKTGNFLDSSKIRGPTNVSKPNISYTGRQVEMYKTMKQLSRENIKLVNLVGIEGIGKTRYLQELSYYMHARSIFQDGIFMLDLRRLKTSEQIKQKLKEINIGGGQSLDINSNLQNKDILLIFDNVDSLLKHNKTQFEWWLMSLVQQQEKLKVIVTTKQPMNPKGYQKLEKSFYFLQLKPLNDIEAVDMIMSNCTREISREELLMSDDPRQSIHHQLQQESSVKKCYGFPKYLEKFAQYLNIHSFGKININDYIPNTKRGQMKRLQKNQHYTDNENGNKVQNVNYVHQNDKKPDYLHYALENQNINYHHNNSKETLNYHTNDMDNSQDNLEELALQLSKIKLSKRNKSKIETQVIKEEAEDDFTESVNTHNSKNMFQKKYSNDEEEEKQDRNSFHKNSNYSENHYKEYDSGFFYNNSVSKDSVYSKIEKKTSGNHGTKNISSSDGEPNEKIPTSMVSYVTKSGITKTIYDTKGSLQNQAQQSLYLSQAEDNIFQNNAARNSLPQKTELSHSNYEEVKEHLQYIQPSKTLQEALMELGDIETVELVFPKLEKAESIQSQPFDSTYEYRGRSNSELENQFRASYYEKNQQFIQQNYNSNNNANNNIRSEEDIFLSCSEYKKFIDQQTINKKEQEKTKPQTKANESTIPKFQSNIAEKAFSIGQFETGLKQQDYENQNRNNQNPFDLYEANSVHSEEVQDEQNSFDEEDDEELKEKESPLNEYEDDNNRYQHSQSLNAKSKQSSSFFTTTSGSGSLGSIKMKRVSTKEDRIMKEKQKARQEFGPRTSRNQRKYQKTTKNKYKQNNEQTQELKKSKKAYDKCLKQEQILKRESSDMIRMEDLPQQQQVEETGSSTNKSKEDYRQQKDQSTTEFQKQGITPKKKDKKKKHTKQNDLDF